jgi:hypothetical protein
MRLPVNKYKGYVMNIKDDGSTASIFAMITSGEGIHNPH